MHSLIGGLPGVNLSPSRVQPCRNDSCADSRLSLYLSQSGYVYTPSWDIFTQCLRGSAITLRGYSTSFWPTQNAHLSRQRCDLPLRNARPHQGMLTQRPRMGQAPLLLPYCSSFHTRSISCITKPLPHFIILLESTASDCENNQVDHAGGKKGCAISLHLI